VLADLKKNTAPAWFVVTSDQRKVIREREQHLRATTDYSQAHRSILNRRGEYTMDMWLHWICSALFCVGVLY
jgi:hypothetical protein